MMSITYLVPNRPSLALAPGTIIVRMWAGSTHGLALCSILSSNKIAIMASVC